MRRAVSTCVGATLMVAAFGLFTLGLSIGTSVGSGTAGAADNSNKAAFCKANIAIDRAAANVNSNAGFLPILKSHAHDLALLKQDAPSGSLGQLVQQILTVADSAVASNNVSELNSLPDGSALDAYCDVNGNGQKLPKDFGQGKSTAFCTTFDPIYMAVGAAPNKAAVLSALSAHQAQINQLRSELSTLPNSVRTKATTAVHNAEKAITTQNSSALANGGGNGPAADVALYCGQDN